MMLYADDAICLLQNPVSSVKMLKSQLKLFGEVSGYKVNKLKSTIMGLKLEREVKEEMSKFDSTPWHSTIKYLGVYITTPLTNE